VPRHFEQLPSADAAPEINLDTLSAALALPSDSRGTTVYEQLDVVEPEEENLYTLPWYFDDVSREQCEKVLLHCSIDSFLVRKSTKQGNFCASTIVSGKIKHYLIERTPQKQWHFSNDHKRLYNSLTDLVNSTPAMRKLSRSVQNGGVFFVL
jgi:SH2 domain